MVEFQALVDERNTFKQAVSSVVTQTVACGPSVQPPGSSAPCLEGQVEWAASGRGRNAHTDPAMLSPRRPVGPRHKQPE